MEIWHHGYNFLRENTVALSQVPTVSDLQTVSPYLVRIKRTLCSWSLKLPLSFGSSMASPSDRPSAFRKVGLRLDVLAVEGLPTTLLWVLGESETWDKKSFYPFYLAKQTVVILYNGISLLLCSSPLPVLLGLLPRQPTRLREKDRATENASRPVYSSWAWLNGHPPPPAVGRVQGPERRCSGV